jgi:hypothetical protein
MGSIAHIEGIGANAPENEDPTRWEVTLPSVLTSDTFRVCGYPQHAKVHVVVCPAKQRQFSS